MLELRDYYSKVKVLISILIVILILINTPVLAQGLSRPMNTQAKGTYYSYAATLEDSNKNYISTQINFNNEEVYLFDKKGNGLGFYIVTHTKDRIYVYELDDKLQLENRYEVSKLKKIDGTLRYFKIPTDAIISGNRVLIAFKHENAILSIENGEIKEIISIPDDCSMRSLIATVNKNYVIAYPYIGTKTAKKNYIFSFENGVGHKVFNIGDEETIKDPVINAFGGERGLEKYYRSKEREYLFGNAGFAAYKSIDSQTWNGFSVDTFLDFKYANKYNDKWISSALDSNYKNGIYTSVDGEKWNKVSAQGDFDIQSILYDGTKYVAMGSQLITNERIYVLAYSQDGVSWTNKYFKGNDNLYIKQSKDGYLVMLDNVAYYIKDILQFDKIDIFNKVPLPGKFSWEKINIPNKNSIRRINDILIDGSNIIAVGSGERIYNTFSILISKDYGNTWNVIQNNDAYGKELFHVSKIDKGYAAFADEHVFIFDNSGTYTVHDIKTTNYNEEIVKNYFEKYKASNNYPKVYINFLEKGVKLDGVNMDSLILEFSEKSPAVWDGEKFIADISIESDKFSLNENGNCLIYSKDGINWNAFRDNIKLDIYSILRVDDTYFGTGHIQYEGYKSFKGKDLKNITIYDEGLNTRDFEYNGKVFIGISKENGKLYTTSDGTTWKEEYIDIEDELLNSVWDGQRLWAVGNNGTIVRGQ